MDERRGVSSRPSRPGDVLGMAVFVLLCAVAVPVVLALAALAVATVVVPPVAFVLSVLHGRLGHAALWAAAGCALYWLDYVLIKALVRSRR